MSIRGGSFYEAARIFCDHFNSVLSRTVTQTRLVLVTIAGGPYILVTFRQAGQPTEARLHTRFGPMGLFMQQLCGSDVVEHGVHELRTLEYRYAVRPEDAREPLLRWEYTRTPPRGALWCRHHLQGPVKLQIHGHTLSLNDLHLPTGYIAFEDILRFCIVDLEVDPLSDDWDGVLRESYARFKTEFTS